MNDITSTKIACTSCGHVEFLPAMTHDENDICVAVNWNATSSNSKKNQQMSEFLTSGDCQPMSTCVCVRESHSMRALLGAQPMIQFFVFAVLDSSKLSFVMLPSPFASFHDQHFLVDKWCIC